MEEQVSRRAGSARLTVIRGTLISTVVFGVFALLWNSLIRAYFFPFGDDLALLSNSCPPFHPSYSDWFLRGFYNYWYVYPDLSAHSSYFIRPMVNLSFFLNWELFGNHWSAYLLLNYLMIGLLSGVTYFIAAQELRLGWRLAVISALCVAVAPSIDSPSLLDPAFAFDLLCGLLVLCGVLALVSDALISCWILLTLAVFTKEASLFAGPLAAAIVWLRLSDVSAAKRVRTALMFLLPPLVWQSFRWFEFGNDRSPNVVGPHGFMHVAIVRLYEGVLTWPVAAMVWDNPSKLQGHVERFALGVNLFFWAIAALLFWKNARKVVAIFRERKLRISSKAYPAFVIGLFCAGSLFMPLVLNLPRRFGGVFYPLFFLSLALCLGRARSTVLKWAAASLMMAIAVCGTYLICSTYQKRLPASRTSWIMAREYAAVLSSLHEPLVFSVNDVAAGFSSDRYVKTFTGYQGDLIRVDNLHADFNCLGKLGVEVSADANKVIRLDSRFPGRCGNFGFDSLFPPLDPGRAELTRTLPEGTLCYHLAAQDPAGSASKELLVEIAPKLDYGAILYPDLENLRYKIIPFRITGETMVLSAPEDTTR
jgi:hypothetical protein